MTLVSLKDILGGIELYLDACCQDYRVDHREDPDALDGPNDQALNPEELASSDVMWIVGELGSLGWEDIWTHTCHYIMREADKRGYPDDPRNKPDETT